MAKLSPTAAASQQVGAADDDADAVNLLPLPLGEGWGEGAKLTVCRNSNSLLFLREAPPREEIYETIFR